MLFEQQHLSFFTATILSWQHLLEADKYKNIIIESLRFLVDKKRVKIYGFVIMPNHIHLLWRIEPPFKQEDVQRDFLKFTAHQIKKDLKMNDLTTLALFKSTQADRKYQIWERNPLSIYCYSLEVILQKLAYIHQNPVKEKWKLSVLPEEYYFSSASFYMKNQTDFDFITHYQD